MDRHRSNRVWAVTSVLLFCAVASPAAETRWYALEGMSVQVPEGYGIDARDERVRQIRLSPDNGGYGSGVWGFLVAERGPGELYLAVIETFALLYDEGSVSAPPGELPSLPSITITEAPSVPERRGFEIVAVSPAGVQAWFHAIRLGDTPGGASGYLLLAPELPGEPGRTALTTILSVLEVRVEDAAG